MKKERVIFAIILLIFFCVAIFCAMQYDRVASRIPLIVAVPGLLLTIYTLIVEIRKKDPVEDKTINKAEEGQEPELCASELKRREWTIILWILLLAVLIYLIGFLFAIPLYFFLMLRLWGKEPWRLVIIQSILSAAVIYLFFVSLLHVNLYEGYLIRTFG